MCQSYCKYSDYLYTCYLRLIEVDSSPAQVEESLEQKAQAMKDKPEACRFSLRVDNSPTASPKGKIISFNQTILKLNICM